MFLLPEEAGEIGGYGVQHMNQFLAGLIPHNVLIIIPKGMKVAAANSFPQSGLDQFLFSIIEVDPTQIVNQAADFFKLGFGHFHILKLGNLRSQSGPPPGIFLSSLFKTDFYDKVSDLGRKRDGENWPLGDMLDFVSRSGNDGRNRPLKTMAHLLESSP